MSVTAMTEQCRSHLIDTDDSRIRFTGLSLGTLRTSFMLILGGAIIASLLIAIECLYSKIKQINFNDNIIL